MTSTEKGPESDVASAPDFDSLSVLVSSLQTRLVSNGEWNKLLRHIRMSLEGSAWEEDMRVFARDKVVESQATIPLRDLILQIGPHAKATIPENLKDELLSKLRIFVENNVEE